MLKEETYIRTSNDFGVSVGVATITGYKHLKDSVKEVGKETYKRMNSELHINGIITDAIDEGIYQQLQRELYRLRGICKRKVSELTIYKKAFNNITNGSKANTKRKKIYSQR
jgi:hypothetical protein